MKHFSLIIIWLWKLWEWEDWNNLPRGKNGWLFRNTVPKESYILQLFVRVQCFTAIIKTFLCRTLFSLSTDHTVRKNE